LPPFFGKDGNLGKSRKSEMVMETAESQGRVGETHGILLVGEKVAFSIFPAM